MRGNLRVYLSAARASRGVTALWRSLSRPWLPPAAAQRAKRRPADDRPTVAVMPNFDNGSVVNHADYDALGKGYR